MKFTVYITLVVIFWMLFNYSIESIGGNLDLSNWQTWVTIVLVIAHGMIEKYLG